MQPITRKSPQFLRNAFLGAAAVGTLAIAGVIGLSTADTKPNTDNSSTPDYKTLLDRMCKSPEKTDVARIIVERKYGSQVDFSSDTLLVTRPDGELEARMKNPENFQAANPDHAASSVSNGGLSIYDATNRVAYNIQTADHPNQSTEQLTMTKQCER
ncbi:MAG TPA: hypothetical protein VLE91_01355 [Candidatus Saccharimonadales bacterium]|nr:hypothetical protein [Candidatus Saccharimonadales bacterium]